MKIIINKQEISEKQLNDWRIHRIKKVFKTLKTKPSSQQESIEQMTKELTEAKLRYSYDEMYDLLKPKLRLSTLAMKVASKLSTRRKFAITEISIDGISAKEISNGIDSLMLEKSLENDKVNLSACPDHYVLRPTSKTDLEVIETCGNAPLPFQFFIVYGDETGVQTKRDLSYPYQSAGVARLKNGTLMGGVRHQFKDTENGFEAKLVVEFPSLCPTYIIKAHQMHLASEFSYWFNWIKNNKEIS